jgi:hypothetical protein
MAPLHYFEIRIFEVLGNDGQRTMLVSDSIDLDFIYQKVWSIVIGEVSTPAANSFSADFLLANSLN